VYDIIVVGGGPAGLYTADQLARSGHSVALFEEHPEIGQPVHCTGLLACEAFTRFALPAVPILAKHGATRFFSPSGYELSYSTPSPETIVIDRHCFDQALAFQAAGAGARLFLGLRVTQVRRGQESIAVQTPRGIFHGKLLILATGAAYHLHRELRLGFPKQFVQTAQAEVEFPPTPEVELYFGTTVASGSFAWVVPIQHRGQAKARIGLMTNKDAEGSFLRFLQHQQIASRLRPRGITRFRRRPIPLTPLAQIFGARVLVVGDAAGLTKPTTGGGIYYSLLSAELAAGVAQQALTTGDCSAEFLSRYQRAWKTLCGREFWWGNWFRWYAERFTDAQIDEAFQLATLEPLDRLIRERAAFNWHSGLIHALVSNAQVRNFFLRTIFTNCSSLPREEVAYEKRPARQPTCWEWSVPFVSTCP
jgi:geranylgeranyl reductase family protein